MDTYFTTGPAQLLLVSVALVLMVASSLLGEFAWRVGNIPAPFIALLTESLKLCISTSLYSKEMKTQKLEPKFDRLFTLKFWWASIYFAIPGGLYFLGNNLALIALKYLSSHLVAMLANFKLLVAAGLASTFLKQKFSMLQWLSLVLVVTGLIITMGNPGKKATEMGEGHATAEDEAEGHDKLLLTILYSVVTACISAVAGVFCEKLYKEKVGEPTLDNVHLQNMKLYVFGIFFNFVAFMLSPNKDFTGFGLVHVILIAISGFQGLAMGFIMKYLDNVVRGIAVAAGSILNTVLSIILLGNELTGAFIVGGLVTLISAHAYRNFPVPKNNNTTNEEKKSDKDAEEGVTKTNSNVAKKPEPKKYSVSFYAIMLIPLLLLPVFGFVEPIDRMLKGEASRIG